MPRLSVIIPVYEQWDGIDPLITALKQQTVQDQEVEIIVVDNGSTAVPPISHFPANVEVITCTQRGSYAARNAGIARARGEWLAFTDADCVPAPHWLEALLRTGEEGGRRTLVAGHVEMEPSSSQPSLWEMYDLVKGIPQKRYVAAGYAATANLLVPRDAINAVGGFDETRMSGGDAAFCRAAHAEGFGIAFAPDAVVRHRARTSWRQLATKARRVKGGQMAPDTPARYRWRIVLPPVFDAARFLGDPNWPLSYRLGAAGVAFALWGVECLEVVRLLAGATPERR